MSGKITAVFGIYPTHDSADAAVDTLRTKGFRSTDVSVLFPQNLGSKEFGHEKGTKSAEGAVAGGGTGAVIGGALGRLAGIGMLAIPGVGPFIAAGPIVAKKRWRARACVCAQTDHFSTCYCRGVKSPTVIP